MSAKKKRRKAGRNAVTTQTSVDAAETRAFSEEQLAWLILGDAASISVTPKTALNCTAVFAAVKVLSETVGQLPIHLYRRTDGAGKERDRQHAAARVVNRFANPWTTATQFREQLMVDLCLHGNCFAWIGRNTRRQVTELQRLDPTAVSVERDQASGAPVYVVSEKGGGKRRYAFGDVLHLQDLSVDGLKGEAPIICGRKAIQLALALEGYALKLFENGARPSAVIETKETLGDRGRKRIQNSFTEGFAGELNAGRVPILDEGMAFKQISLASTDAQFLELRKFAVLEIARLFRMPPHFLAELERTTHSNAYELGAQFLTYTMLPWFRAWQDELALKLLTPKEQDAYFFEFLVDDLVRADIAARFTAYSQAVTNGILNPNEVRAAENRAPYPGGDQFRLPLNTENPANAA